MAKIHKKAEVEESCYDLAVRRMAQTFQNFDKVVVSFSGGKDSTACLHLALEEARRSNRLPLDVVFFDEECIPPETVEYVERVAANPDIRLLWFCLPLKLGNACSKESPDWYIWNEADREKWVRPLPERAVRTWPTFRRGMGLADFGPTVFGPEHGRVAWVLGIRTQESMTRYQSIATKIGFQCFIIPSTMNGQYANVIGLRKRSSGTVPCKWSCKVYPIYDLTTEDVWKAPEILGWDYNKAYDVMRACGLPPLVARCSPTFGDQTNRRLWSYKVCWPKLWAKMVDRVPGAATAARYANTELYGIGVKDSDQLEGKSWRQMTMDRLANLSGNAKIDVGKAIKGALQEHKNIYGKEGLKPTPFPDAEQDPISGYSWKLLHRIAAIGGDKFGRQSQFARKQSNNVRKLRRQN
jgi:predicted phosphoadenosine phosphosulfate sulfurtransferase